MENLMEDVVTILNKLSRPKLLIRAARIGAQSYRRNVHLRKHFGYGAMPRSGQALLGLLEMETALNEQRREKDASYSAVRHVEILIAMMGEARILRASPAQNTT